jgi:hypothetical protein
MARVITPGPWTIEPEPGGDPIKIRSPHAWRSICEIWAGSESRPNDADARLIAASPLLLRACKAALARLIEANGGLTHGIEDEVSGLREAIAAAEGEQVEAT